MAATFGLLNSSSKLWTRRALGSRLCRNITQSTTSRQLEIDQCFLDAKLEIDLSSFGASEIENIYLDSCESLKNLGNNSATNAVAFAHERLLALGMSRDTESSSSIGVLFLCGHNAGRSQMAAAMLTDRLERLFDSKNGSTPPVVAFSGGSTPSNELNPICVQAMKEIGIDLSSAFPKPWTPEVASASNMIITMGCGDKCPVIPGQICVNWELDDPHGQGIDMVRNVRDQIEEKILSLIENDLNI
mmetsp:Transcript_3901/g.4764  ORF Transcript_3901/g.4764 Transcript_3901/m.4764 type:complete len:245 (+) Transcript_3901:150-884(+)|eukprot:CAMPEP_0184025304 /NCGR_PEP_ID=MMETSP0954-20121128/12713_1 /TAXON_ID=627963 /ORGANISM="Aplanochytrium sp, Strain PBS07" /LENGTH=244 /DNA_ID=CAMNT_0026309027 /DNA_START=6 /DNA_END=740 /DNA_ORIENTATION=-